MPNETKTKTRLKELREEAGLSQNAMAKALGVSYAGYQNYEYGKRDIPGDVLIKASNFFGVTIDYLLHISPWRNQLEKIRAEVADTVDVPVYGSIAAGTPIEMIEIEESFPVPRALLEMHGGFDEEGNVQAFLLKIKGESMNQILQNGVLGLTIPCSTIDYDNDPYAVCVNGYDATAKRVHKLNNGFELRPDSTDPTFKPTIYDYGVPGTDTITVIGHIVHDFKPFDWRY